MVESSGKAIRWTFSVQLLFPRAKNKLSRCAQYFKYFVLKLIRCCISPKARQELELFLQCFDVLKDTLPILCQSAIQ